MADGTYLSSEYSLTYRHGQQHTPKAHHKGTLWHYTNNSQSAVESAKYESGFHPSEVESRPEQSLLLRTRLRQIPQPQPHKGQRV